jgi:hypothetical protein
MFSQVPHMHSSDSKMPAGVHKKVTSSPWTLQKQAKTGWFETKLGETCAAIGLFRQALRVSLSLRVLAFVLVLTRLRLGSRLLFLGRVIVFLLVMRATKKLFTPSQLPSPPPSHAGLKASERPGFVRVVAKKGLLWLASKL